MTVNLNVGHVVISHRFMCSKYTHLQMPNDTLIFDHCPFCPSDMMLAFLSLLILL
uniref:Uncharacterized protein n=1 Tax=Oryza brachyantha TaxID=4533 RepID=J3L007_ORYBR